MRFFALKHSLYCIYSIRYNYQLSTLTWDLLVHIKALFTLTGLTFSRHNWARNGLKPYLDSYDFENIWACLALFQENLLMILEISRISEPIRLFWFVDEIVRKNSKFRIIKSWTIVFIREKIQKHFVKLIKIRMQLNKWFKPNVLSTLLKEHAQ